MVISLCNRFSKHYIPSMTKRSDTETKDEDEESGY